VYKVARRKELTKCELSGGVDAARSKTLIPVCNIPPFEDRNREEINVCIAFMHRKSGDFSRFYIKYIKVIGVSLELIELK
jgi:hypothetical protein